MFIKEQSAEILNTILKYAKENFDLSAYIKDNLWKSYATERLSHKLNKEGS